MTEEYLRLNISLPNKRLVAQHRVLWQFFREERKDFWKENGRNCLLCKDLMDDNLVHYFFQCPLLTEKRTETFPSPTSGQFRYQGICQLLSSALNDKLMIDKYFKFCTEAGRIRKNAGQRILEDEPSVNRNNSFTVFFIIFINDLVATLDDSDLQGIYLPGHGTIHLLLYFEENGLTLNQSKSKIVVFRNGGRLARSDVWFWGQQPMTVSSKYTYLGYPLTTKNPTAYVAQHFNI
ncbi:hypothetical protein LAZ67_4002249 [Cordylochernes scorpioides]|uniref:Reverse transcriptase zinc-binding domain-containing protein n=1 Tax=Cordylochernes scorpioides TaxID=51811 RepID=A0ABY6KCL5_9ARAC|nr:hypothetical protein LAZ67_4002249 [Cordylochernes scorpioides]